MTRYMLADDTAIILTDASTGESATTTKYAAREVLAAWYGELAADDETTRDEVARVAHEIEDCSDLSGSDYLGLTVALAD